MGAGIENIVDEAKGYVIRVLEQQLPDCCVFHSTKHTLDVLKNVEIIGKYSGLTGINLDILKLCALFHDIGYVDAYDGHENVSVAMAKSFLKQRNVKETEIKIVERAILNTKVPQQPRDIYSRILCDADLMHLASDSYFEMIEPMRKEWKLCGIAAMSEVEFHKNSIRFFTGHKYHSEYGIKVLKPKKEKVLEKIRERVAEIEKSIL